MWEIRGRTFVGEYIRIHVHVVLVDVVFRFKASNFRKYLKKFSMCDDSWREGLICAFRCVDVISLLDKSSLYVCTYVKTDPSTCYFMLLCTECLIGNKSKANCRKVLLVSRRVDMVSSAPWCATSRGMRDELEVFLVSA